MKLDWRLPARLRKPVKQQIAAERKRQQAKAGFERRPLTTRHLLGGRAVQEAHTRDTHTNIQPGVRLIAPPYAGRFVRTLPRATGSVARETEAFPATAPSLPKRTPVPARDKAPAFFERDIHYEWGAADTDQAQTFFEKPDGEAEVPLAPVGAEAAPESGEIRKPRRFSLPFSLNIIPRGLLTGSRRSEVRQAEPSKKKLESEL